jgi:hypothetical protein
MGVLTEVEIGQRDHGKKLAMVNGGGGESSSSPQLLENGGPRLRIALDAIETGEARVPFIVVGGESNGQKIRGHQRWWVLKTSVMR